MLYSSCTVLAKYLQGIGIKLLVHCTGAAHELLPGEVLGAHIMSSMCNAHAAHDVCNDEHTGCTAVAAVHPMYSSIAIRNHY